jgi:hypothetical protein
MRVAADSAPDMESASLLDRVAQREFILGALGSHSRILVSGPPEAEVSPFAEWIASACAGESRCIWWDFERAPGVEGVDILREIAQLLPDANGFSLELSTVASEFRDAPQAHVTQVIGDHAQAGHDQAFSAEVNVPTLADYFGRNLNRLARALFRDIEDAAGQGHILFMVSGIRVGGEDPTPSEDLLNVILSTVWRLAENCAADRLCVVIAATTYGDASLKTAGYYLKCDLDLVEIEEATGVFVEAIAGLTPAEARSVVLSSAVPGSGGLTYTSLRERIAFLALNRLELTLGGAVDG